MRTRLRPAHDAAALAAMYAAPHDHAKWGRGHGERVAATIAAGRSLDPPPESVADLSCGNAAIPRALHPSPVLGDLAPGYALCGPVEETVALIDPVDLIVSCETLEHLDDPAAVLAAFRGKCRRLLLSTPVDNWGDTNLEHYWAWSDQDVSVMLGDAGFKVRSYSAVDSRLYGEPYCYGIWVCD